MIRRLGVENIRVFGDGGWEFSLCDLTVLCGTNNSGKSTLLKTLLFLRQSMGIGEGYTHTQGKPRFVGSQVDLGNYQSLVSHNEDWRDISISLTTEGMVPTVVANELKSRTRSGEESITDDSKDPCPYSLTSGFRFGLIVEPESVSDNGDRRSPSTPQAAVTGSSRAFLKEATFGLSIEDQKVLSWHVQYSELDEDGDPRYDLVIPRSYFASNERFARLQIAEDLGETVKVHVGLSDLLPQMMIAQLLAEGDEAINEEADEKWVIEPLPAVIYNVSRHLRQTMTQIHYIGPLRSAAERYYISRPDMGQSLDPAGEFLPHILRDADSHDAWHIAPGLDGKRECEPLSIALTRWMRYLRTGKVLLGEGPEKEIDWDVARRVLLEIDVRSPIGDELHALADSGFGYSQLLPIVVRGLLTPPEHTLIIEQPELHLNPAIQVRMAEFLVSMALAEKQVLIETHSEHIVNTIRVLAAEDESGKIGPMCEIVYLDVDPDRTRPKVHELSVRADGSVPEWPRKFFGEAASLSGRLLRAQAQVKRGANERVIQ